MLLAEVELYTKDQPVFLKDRVGIVTMGSVEARKHDSGRPLRPYILKKAIEGDVLGFGDGDCNATSCPLAWLISMQSQTEVLYLPTAEFLELWNLQKKFTEQQIVIQRLEQNNLFNALNTITKY